MKHPITHFQSTTGALFGPSLLMLSLLPGCAVGPDFVPPAAPEVTRFTTQPQPQLQPQPVLQPILTSLPEQSAATATAAGDAAQQRLLPGQDIPAQWWLLFHSPALNGLIEQALQHNPTLQSAQAALRVAQENVYAQQGAYYPSVGINAMSARQQEATGSVSSSASSGASLFNLHTAQVSVSYSVDVFGVNHRQVEGLQAQADFQRYQLEATYLTLTSNVVLAAIQEASLRAQINAINTLIDVQQQQLDLFRRQLELGAIAEASVIGQVATLAQTRALLPALQKQLAQQRDLIAALAGRLPSDGPDELFDFETLSLPQAVPLGLPSSLVAQRPDVRAAEEQLHAASAAIGVAKANMLPQFVFSAGGGSMATGIGRLFSSGNGFWNLAAGLTQPLFDGGTLLHRKRAAEAAYDQAGAQYRSTVIAAFQNVADSIEALQADTDALQLAVVAERATATSLALVKRQVALGDISYLGQLATEQAYQQSLLNLILAQASRYADTAALFQALGGGWWNRSEVAAVAVAN
jgi:NodT family efflux transporter outer membrane factor (OMF) lipoprotein